MLLLMYTPSQPRPAPQAVVAMVVPTTGWAISYTPRPGMQSASLTLASSRCPPGHQGQPQPAEGHLRTGCCRFSFFSSFFIFSFFRPGMQGGGGGNQSQGGADNLGDGPTGCSGHSVNGATTPLVPPDLNGVPPGSLSAFSRTRLSRFW